MGILSRIFGIQLLIFAVWNFYFYQYLIGFGALSIAFIILLPFVFKLIDKKLVNPILSGLAIFGIVIMFLVPVVLDKVKFMLTVPNQAHLQSIINFERSLNQKSKPCLTSFETCFPKKPEPGFDACGALNLAKNTCVVAEPAIKDIVIDNILPGEVKSLLTEVKVDAEGGIKNLANVYGEYSKLCSAEKQQVNANSVKMEMLSSSKNKYFMNMKIKKAKAILGF